MSQCQIFTPGEIASFRTGGAILSACLRETAKRVAPGVTTAELDAFAERFIREKGGTPAFKGYRGYPATLCTSVNEECVHGIPGDRALIEGDIISIDGGVLLDDLYTDACITVPVGAIGADAQKLLAVTEEALERALKALKAGVRVGDLSAAVQQYVESQGCSAIPVLTGHGVGRNLHQFPDIPNVGKAGTGAILPSGTVIAVEPIIAFGGGAIRESGDGWTIRTADGSLSAHVEHTVLVTDSGCDIIA